MPKVIELNESVKQMTLNADNRRAFINAILKEVMQARSDEVRNRMFTLKKKLVERTWGANTQARTANKRAADKIRADIKKLSDKGFSVRNVSIGDYSSNVTLNLAGRCISMYFHEAPCVSPVVNFQVEFMQHSGYYVNGKGVDTITEHMGNDSLTLKDGDPLLKEFWTLKDEADAIKDAAEQLTSILNSVLGKAKKLGQALEKWPELSQYAPAILSACREITVHPDVLNKILDGLADGKQPVSKVMKAAEAE